MKTLRILVALGFLGIQLMAITGLSGNGFVGAVTAYAEEAWKAEFDEVCSKTNDAMSLTKEELKSLIEKCDTLTPKIEKLDETRKKVYMKRLQKCRDLFKFVLESKEKN